MGRHMLVLHGTHIRVSSRQHDQAFINHVFNIWLDIVFQEIPFSLKVEHAFREKMGQIIDETQDQTYFEVGFSKMNVRSPEMLRLYNLLNEVEGKNDMFKKGSPKRKFSGNLLGPIRRSILSTRRDIEPKATGVLKTYDAEAMDTLPAFVRSVIKQEQELEPKLLSTIERPHEYDDAVSEAIGRIMLEWNKVAPKGGATRKRKRERVCKLTKRRRVSKGNRRATHKAINKKHKHKHTRTRRA